MMTMTSLAPTPMAAPATGRRAGLTDAASSGIGAEFAALIGLSLDEQAGTSAGGGLDGEPSVPAAVTGPATAETPTGVDPLIFQLVAGVTVPETDHSEEPAPDSSAEGDQTSTAMVQLLTSPQIAAVLSQIAPPDPRTATAPAQPVSGTPAAVENALTVPSGSASTSPPEASAANKTPLATGVVSLEQSSPAISAQEAPSSSGETPEMAAVTLDSSVLYVATPGPVAGPLQVHGTGKTPAASVAQTVVTNQVFPDVARLMTRADGTQRITLRLTPENLGEVRIMLTVRDGAVQVDLSASSYSLEALRSGAHQLHRLLELAGATSSQIKVVDSSTGNSATTSDSLSQDGFTRPGSDTTGHQGRDPDQPARTRAGDTSARDGGTPGAASLRTMTNQESLAPYLGVDVTI